MKKHIKPKIEDLFPDLTPEQMEEAESNLKRYVGVVTGIYDRLDREGRLDELRSLLLTEQWKKKQ